MTPGALEFAQALLDQLRRDLRKFAPGRLEELDLSLNKHPGYFRQLKAKRLKMRDAFAAIRFMGFSPNEYFTLNRPEVLEEPQLGSGFLGRYRLLPTDRIKVESLPDLLSWGFSVQLSDRAPVLQLDLGHRLDSLGASAAKPEDIFKYAGVVFRLVQKERPESINPVTALGFIHTGLFLAEIIPTDRANQRAVAQLLDLGFRFEKELDVPGIRPSLFAAAARVCSNLGHHHDGIWCARQACYSAIYLSDLRRVFEYQELMTDIASRAKLPIFEDGSPVEFGPLAQGQQDQESVLTTLLPDREASSVSASELDRRIGGQRAFANALGRRGSMPVWRWRTLTKLLGVSPIENLDRACALTTLPPPVGALFLSLKESLSGKHNFRFSFQRPFLEYCEGVQVSDSAERLTLDLSPLACAFQDQHFEPAVRALKDFSSALPSPIHLKDLVMIGEGALGLSFALRRRGLLSDSADLLTAAFRLFEKTGNAPKIARGFRLGTNLAIDMGNLPIAALAIKRAVEIELSIGSPNGLHQSLYSGAFVRRLQGDFLGAIQLYSICKNLAETSEVSIPRWVVAQSLAATHLLLNDLEEAANMIEIAEREMDTTSLAPADQVDIALVKAQYISKSSGSDEALQLLDRASLVLKPEDHARDLVLIGLEKCDHFLRTQTSERAQQVAKELLPLASYLTRNPIGIQAIHELARRSLLGFLEPKTIELTRQKLRFPYLPTRTSG